jgi:hypothetical protein
MNQIMKFSSKVPDNRCQICRHHDYLVLSEQAGVFALHTWINLLRGEAFPYIQRHQGIHWWGVGLNQTAPPICLVSYIKIGGSK